MKREIILIPFTNEPFLPSYSLSIHANEKDRNFFFSFVKRVLIKNTFIKL